MNKLLYPVLGLAFGVLVVGCEKEVPAPEHVQKGPVLTESTTSIDITANATGPAAPPPPGVTPPPAASVAPSAPVNPAGALNTLVSPGDIFFYDDEGNFLAKDGADFLERAIRSYNNARKYKSDDSPDWPPMTDLGLLVQYRVIKAIPAAPAGQKYSLNVETSKVTLTAN